MRDLCGVINRLRAAIQLNGQMTASIQHGLDSISESHKWSAPEMWQMGWNRLAKFMMDTFPDDNPHTAEYKRIFSGAA